MLIAHSLLVIVKFQSLFFWMMPTGPPFELGKIEDIKFQSLFFWMMPTGTKIKISKCSKK